MTEYRPESLRQIHEYAVHCPTHEDQANCVKEHTKSIRDIELNMTEYFTNANAEFKAIRKQNEKICRDLTELTKAFYDFKEAVNRRDNISTSELLKKGIIALVCLGVGVVIGGMV